MLVLVLALPSTVVAEAIESINQSIVPTLASSRDVYTVC